MSGVQDKVQQHYDQVAEIYDSRYNHKRGRSYHAHISRHVMSCLPEGGMLLDLGCGTGLFVHRYSSQGGNAVGLDFSRGMIFRARDRNRDSDFGIGNAEILPFRDKAFDAVASLLAFSYLKNPEQMLAEAWRVLKPGGTLAICTLGRNLLTSGLPAVYTLGEVMRIRRVGMGAFGERYYAPDEMTGLFEMTGFREVTARRCSFAHLNLVDPLYSLARRIEPFVEEKIPSLAYNLLVSGRKPDH
ncbi:MAG: class I SAM-dependent methyltransferase [Methanolinea sp.]|jgi:ubiquinone/menaquinone biosynthesis C-methylase UbiE|nr:class I SAM-dependent methyltransferase [Methanolinea sp.]